MYNCNAPANGNILKVSSNNDFKFDAETIGEMYTSYMTELSLQNLKNEKYDNYMIINNGKKINVKWGIFHSKEIWFFGPDKVDEIPFIFNDI